MCYPDVMILRYTFPAIFAALVLTGCASQSVVTSPRPKPPAARPAAKPAPRPSTREVVYESPVPPGRPGAGL